MELGSKYVWVEAIISKVITLTGQLRGGRLPGDCRSKRVAHVIFAKLNATNEFAQLAYRFLIVLILNSNIQTMEILCFPSYAPCKCGAGKFLHGILLMVF